MGRGVAAAPRITSYNVCYTKLLRTDAASDTTMAGLGKGFTFADVEAVNRACVAEQLPCAHFVIFGGPGETEATVQ